MVLKYLITGATGGLGAQVLKHLTAQVPSSEYAAAHRLGPKVAYSSHRMGSLFDK